MTRPSSKRRWGGPPPGVPADAVSRGRRAEVRNSAPSGQRPPSGRAAPPGRADRRGNDGRRAIGAHRARGGRIYCHPGSFTVTALGIRVRHMCGVHAALVTPAGWPAPRLCHSDMPFRPIPCHYDRLFPRREMRPSVSAEGAAEPASRHPREVRGPAARRRSAARRPRGGRGRATSATRAATASAPFGPGSRRT